MHVAGPRTDPRKKIWPLLCPAWLIGLSHRAAGQKVLGYSQTGKTALKDQKGLGSSPSATDCRPWSLAFSRHFDSSEPQLSYL